MAAILYILRRARPTQCCRADDEDVVDDFVYFMF
jgi:hypothetical protein